MIFCSTRSTGGAQRDAGVCLDIASNLMNTQGYLSGYGATGMSNSADFNGDGLLDVVLADYSGFWVLLGLADGGAYDPGPYPESYAAAVGPIYAADVNGDGSPDVICVGDTGLDVLLNVFGDGRLTPAQPLIAAELGLVVALDVGDLNQDRVPDVLVGRKTDSGVVIDAFLGIGDGQFSPAVELASLQDQQGSFDFPTATVFLSDLNQDGFPDVVAAGCCRRPRSSSRGGRRLPGFRVCLSCPSRRGRGAQGGHRPGSRRRVQPVS